MSETKPSMQPPGKSTVEFEQPPAWAISFAEKQAQGFATLNAKLAGIETTVDTLVEDGKAANKRMTTIEYRMDQFEERGTKHSSGLTHESKVNEEQNAAIAKVVTTQEMHTSKLASLEETQTTQLAILTRLDAVAANPMVRRVAYAIGGAILAYLASKGWLTR